MSQGNDSIKIVVYDPFNPNQTVDTKKDIVHDKNLVKWNLGMLVRGAFEVDYERCLGDKLTFEIGAGITYCDFFYLFNDDLFDNGSGDIKYKYGPLFTADLRFYPRSVGDFDGLYVALPFRYRSYLSEETVTYHVDNGFNSNEYTTVMDNNHKHTEIGFIVGTQTGNDWDLTFDYYFGVGLSTIERVYPYFDNAVSTAPIRETEKTSRPVIYFGFKMGIPF